MKSQTIPEGFELLPTPSGVIIRKIWLSWTIAPLILFAVVWDGFLFSWYRKALLMPHGAPLMQILFPIGHLAVGIGLTYYIIASFVNKTDITIAPSSIANVTGPFPWFGNKRVEVADITDIIVRERSGNKGSISYVVMYVDRSLKERSFTSGISKKEQAEFIVSKVREITGLKKEEA